MEITAQAFDDYTASVSRQANDAAKKLEAFMNGLDFSGTYEARKEARNAVIEYMQILVSTYGDSSATIAADFYNEIAEKSGASVANAVLAEVSSDASIAGSVRYNAKKLFGQEPDADAFKRMCCASISRFIKKAANDTMSDNAVRDGVRGAKFARIPKGTETCAFCVMLASRGFVYASKENAGEFSHFHDYCDCKVVVGFGDSSIEKYDLEKYQKIYDAAWVSDVYGHVNADATLKNIKLILTGNKDGIARSSVGLDINKI